MRKMYLIILAAMTLFSCQTDELTEQPDSNSTTEPSGMNLKIEIDAIGTRAMEELHEGTTVPKIYSVTLYAYNSYGTLTQIDLLEDQVKEAIQGTFKNAQGTDVTGGNNGKGANIALPVGTSSVDVVLNNTRDQYTDISTNINYYNHRKDDVWTTTKPAGGSIPNGDNNFDRVFLTTEYYGTGIGAKLPTTATGKDANGIPVYELGTFTVKPMLARFEIYGSINVEKETDFKDKYGVSWKKILKGDLTSDGYDDLVAPGVTGSFKEGIKVGPDENGVAGGMIYIPEYYWTGTSGMEEALNATNIKDGAWKKCQFYNLPADGGSLGANAGKSPTVIKWFPNAFYAIDLEEIYVNNIYVRGSSHDGYTPYLLPWPESGYANGWPHWYKSYHLEGWHTAGTSADNKFLCMGNMWDRVAAPSNTDETTGFKVVDWSSASLNIPSTDGSGKTLKMNYITSKAIPVANVSGYGDATSGAERNLGLVLKDAKTSKEKVAAYMIYPQSGTSGASNDILRGDLPHIILKVKCYANKTDYDNGKYNEAKQFITLSLFKNGSNSVVTSFERGKVYILDINDLKENFVGDRPVPGVDLPDGKEPTDPVDPDPEMPGLKGVIKIKVENWTSEKIHPVI